MAPDRPSVSLRIPVTTVFTVAIAIALVAAMWLLKSFLAVIAFAILLAVALWPFVRAMTKRKVPHALAVGVAGLCVLLVMGGIGAITGPALGGQLKELGARATELKTTVEKKAETTPLLKKGMDEAKDLTRSENSKAWMQRAGVFGAEALAGIIGLALVFILGMYLLLDGERAFAWAVAFVPRKHRLNVKGTAEEVAQVIRSYVRGQLITSAVCGVFTFGLLTILKVPAPIPVAIIAALFDVLPVLGFMTSTTIAGALALTVSPTTCLIVVASFLAYQAFENYVISPNVYGRTLDMSKLAVTLAILVGGILAGVVGAVLALPLVAAYPIIERRWLRKQVGQETVEDHQALEKTDGEAAAQIVHGVKPDTTAEAPH